MNEEDFIEVKRSSLSPAAQNLIEAHHQLYLALECMRHTESTKQEDFDKLIGIYISLDEFMHDVYHVYD